MNHQIPNLLLLLLSVFSHFSCFLVLVPVNAEVFLSIDCGSSSLKPYTDYNSIVWVEDGPYIQTGETHKVMIDAPDVEAWDSRVMSSLRAFPTHKKNCYSIDIDDKAKDSTSTAKGEKFLVRASFYYGNYDNKFIPPTFSLQFNGNTWSQIVTDQDSIIYAEMVFSLNKGKNINICLAQTQPDNIPFISALEVRSLNEPLTYSYINRNHPLFFFERFAFGTSTTIRYPDDDVDRIWAPFQTNIGVRSNSLYRNVIIDDEKALESLSAALKQLIEIKNSSLSSPPVAFLLNNYDGPPKAILKTHLSSSEKLAYTGVSDPKVPINHNAYFSEATRLNSTQKRSFDILVNNKLDGVDIRPSSRVTPHFGFAKEVLIFNVTSFATNSSYSIDFVPTDDSTLPPLINAIEGYTVGDKLVQGTNSSDVNSLSLLQKSFLQLGDWNGDPCLPSPYTWDWVACSSDADSPRITALYLNDLGLVGTLPDFSDMDALDTIDLHNNSLMGEIPDFLGIFPKLRVLNLADNNFSGTIPLLLSNNVNLKLNSSGNPNLSCKNTSVCNTDAKSRIPSLSNKKSYLTLTRPILILLTLWFIIIS